MVHYPAGTKVRLNKLARNHWLWCDDVIVWPDIVYTVVEINNYLMIQSPVRYSDYLYAEVDGLDVIPFELTFERCIERLP